MNFSTSLTRGDVESLISTKQNNHSGYAVEGKRAVMTVFNMLMYYKRPYRLNVHQTLSGLSVYVQSPFGSAVMFPLCVKKKKKEE